MAKDKAAEQTTAPRKHPDEAPPASDASAADLGDVEEPALDALVKAMLCWQTLAQQARVRAGGKGSQDASARMTQVLQALLYCYCADDASKSTAEELLAKIWEPAHSAFDGRRFRVRTASSALSWRLMDGYFSKPTAEERRLYSGALRRAVAYILRSDLDAAPVGAVAHRIVAEVIRPNSETAGFARLLSSLGVDHRGWSDDTWTSLTAEVQRALGNHGGDAATDADEAAKRVIVTAFKAIGLPPKDAESLFDAADE